jgi:fibronectin type 3 domain-containing protein
VSRVTRRRLLALCLAVGALAACGKKGPPVAPEVRVPTIPVALRGAVDDRSIVVTWNAPGTRVDGSRLRAIALYRLYRREEADTGPAKSAMLSSGHIVGYDEVAAIRPEAPAPATVQGGSVTWVDRRALSTGRRYVYVVTAEDNLGRTSGPSERLIVPFLSAPPAPRGLTAAPGDRRVSLSWQAPETAGAAGAAAGEIRYLVLRGTGAAGALAPIIGEPVAGTTFTDTGVDNDADYRYAVRSVRVEAAVTATGEASPPITVSPADTTPPGAPTGLVAVPTSGAVRLAWNPSPETDVATYAVYRAGETGDFMRIATAVPPGTVYVDRDVRPGATYRYAVTAIDRARRPNESARSNVVSVRVE